MQFVDLKTQFQELEAEIRSGLDAVLRHGKYIMGPEVYELEERLAEYCRVKHVISCSSGTDALLMVLMAQGIGPGDAVFTTPFTFVATAEAISLLGATPVFVDIEPDTLTLDPIGLERAIAAIRENDPALHPLPATTRPSLRPRAIIPVDIFGLPADFDPIMRVARRENLFVLEDGAQGFGGDYKGHRACTLGHAGVTSFFPAKPLGCYGDGGAVFTNDEQLAATLKSLRIHGQGSEKYDNIQVGLNARLDTLQAAVLLPKLKVFPQELETRKAIAQKYTALLRQRSNSIGLQHVPEHSASSWAQFSILSENRDELQAALRQHDIPTMIYYSKGLHRQTAYLRLSYTRQDFPVTEATSKKILNLPMHPYLPDETIEHISDIIGSFRNITENTQ